MARAILDFNEFKRSLADDQPPESCAAAMRALWHDAKGDSQRAFDIACRFEDKTTARVRAYLHRKREESTLATIWYWKAGVPAASGNLQDEWQDIVHTILTQDIIMSAYEF